MAALAARIIAAIGGGYALAALATAWLARILPLPAVEATVAATLASFLFYAAAIITAFALRSVVRVWLCFALAAALLGGLLWIALPAGAPL
jgi:hypothetical protein